MAKIVGRILVSRLRCTCPKCGAIIEYDPTELQNETDYDYTGDSYTYSYLVCPDTDCKKRIRIG